MIRRLIVSGVSIVLLAATWSSLCGAVLDIQIVDEEGSPLLARVLVRPQGGQCVLPEDAVEQAR